MWGQKYNGNDQSLRNSSFYRGNLELLEKTEKEMSEREKENGRKIIQLLEHNFGKLKLEIKKKNYGLMTQNLASQPYGERKA